MQVTSLDQSSLYSSIYWADGTVIYGGYLYAINYLGDTNLIKVNLNNLSDATVRDMSGDVGFTIGMILGLTEVGGYLYFADAMILEHQPHLFKINPSTMEIIDSWEIFTPLIEGMNGGDAICSDTRYVYIGGYEKNVLKFDTQTENVTTLSITNIDFHSMCVDDDYLWAHNNNNLQLYKIDKSTMTVSGTAQLPNSQKVCDDITQDDDYVYNAGEQQGSAPYGIRRIKKSDLSVETIYPGGENGYDGILRIGTELFVPICQVADDEKYYVRRIDLDSFEHTETITLLGMADNPSKKINDILTYGKYIYITLYTGDPAGFQVFKFNRFDPTIKLIISGADQDDLDAENIIINTECPTALVTTRIESLSESVTYALNNNYSIISRSVFGLADTVNEGVGDTAWDGEVVDGAFSSAFSKAFDANVLRRVGIVHSFGEDNTNKEFTEPTRLDVICSVAGTDCNYGDGLEFITDDTTSSIATARVAGVIAQIMVDNLTWNFHDARMALRQTASFYATGWIEDGGYGAVDKTAAKAVTSLELSSPTRVTYSDSTFTWVNSWLTDFDSTVIALSCTEPDRDTDINDLYVLYDGSLEECSTTSLKLNGDYWIVYLSKNSDSDYSEIESFDKDEMTFTYTAENVSCSIQAQTINCTLEAQTINCTLEIG